MEKVEVTFGMETVDQMKELLIKGVEESRCSFHYKPHRMAPFLKGWKAGIVGLDPRLCPYPKMTREWKEWQSFHTKASHFSRWCKGEDLPEWRN